MPAIQLFFLSTQTQQFLALMPGSNFAQAEWKIFRCSLHLSTSPFVASSSGSLHLHFLNFFLNLVIWLSLGQVGQHWSEFSITILPQLYQEYR